MKNLPFLTLCWIVSLGFILFGGFYLGRWVEKQEQAIAITQANLTQPPRITQVNEPIMFKAIQYPTGYDVWNEVNKYRVSQGKKEMILDKRFCNNIASRQQNYRKNNNHDGLKEFVREYIPDVSKVTEILNWGESASEIVKGWAGSPSHNIFLLENNRGCAYSDDGYSVILMGY